MVEATNETVVEPMLHFVFDGPPGPECGRFVECETPDGRSINAGTWHERADGFWELRVAAARPSQPPVMDVERVTMAIYEALPPGPRNEVDCELAARAAIKAMGQ